jgi:hypothetical protein
MHQQLWGYKVEWKNVSRGTGGKRLNTTGLYHDEGFEMNGVHQLSLYASYVNISAEISHEISVDGSKEVGLEVNAEEK